MARFIITGEYKDKATKLAKKDLQSLSRSTINYGKIATKYWGIATAAVTYYVQKGLRASITAAAEDEKSQKSLAFTLMSVANANEAATIASEANIKAMSAMFGIADDNLRPALARLVRITGSVTEASNSLNLALSLSAATGASLEQTTAALGRAYTGNYKALRSLGLQIDENLIKNKDTKRILNDLQRQYGDFARNQLDTTATQFARIRVAAGEASETIGVALVDSLNRLFKSSNGVDAIASRFDTLANSIADIVTGLTDVTLELGKADKRTGNIISRTAKWVYENWTILGLLQKQGRQTRINTALIKSQSTQIISARNAEMMALKKTQDSATSIQNVQEKTVDQLIAEEAARKAGFKITEDLDSIQTVAAAKRLEESRQYKMSLIDAAQAGYDAFKKTYDQLQTTLQGQIDKFNELKTRLEQGITIPLAVTAQFGGGGMVAAQAAQVVPAPSPTAVSNFTAPDLATRNAIMGQAPVNVTVNAGAVGSEQYLADLIVRSITQANKNGFSTIPAGTLP